jgi:hypothetical protein
MPTRLNGVTNLIPFVFNDAQAYALAFSNGKFRIFSDGGVVTEDAKTPTVITKANPGVITVTTHGYATGDQIFISDVGGMVELNEKFYLVVYVDANKFSLKDLDGNAINTSGFTTFTSGGSIERVYEVTSPYATADLDKLKYAQKADLMYIVHPDFEPRKLIRAGETSWTISTFTRTADPFVLSVTTPGITQANPCVVNSTDHGLSTGDIIEIYGVVGMTQVNGNTYSIVKLTANTFSLKDPDTLVDINSTGYTAYSSGGYLFLQGNMPGAVAFYGGRLFYGGPNSDPETLFGSRAPDDTGISRFDDYTLGSDADDAVIFPIASQNNTADKISWFAGTNKFLSIGTYGAIYKAFGASETEPITGVDISVSPVDFYGVQDIAPARIGTSIFYVQRGGLIVNRFAYSLLEDTYSSEDLNVLSDEITVTGIKQLALQQGRLNILWAVRNDGVLLGLSTKEQEKIAAWHTHYLGGTAVKVLSACGEPRSDNSDRLWLVVEREIEGVTRRYMEYFGDDPVLPSSDDFYTGNETSDYDAFIKVQGEVMKQFVRVDSSLTLDTTQSLGLALGAITGTGITFTAAGNLFSASDVGRRIVRKYTTGFESGVAEITAFTSATQVVCTILEDFESVTVPADGWYLTVTEVNHLEHLEGETVTVVTDGSVHPQKTVVDGSITLDYSATVVHVGLGYLGWLKTMPLNPTTAVGNPMTRTSIVDKVGLLLRDTLGVRYGTNEYRLEQVVFRTTNDRTGNPPPLFTGAESVLLKDGYDEQKFIHVVQSEPLPCTIQAIIPYVNVTEE